MLDAPDGDARGALQAGAPLTVLERSGEWVRVQTEGWIKETDLRPSEGGILFGVSGTDVRAQPEEFVGKLLEWTIQYVSIQVGDGVRREIPEGQQYMLADFTISGNSEYSTDELKEYFRPVSEGLFVGDGETAEDDYFDQVAFSSATGAVDATTDPVSG